MANKAEQILMLTRAVVGALGPGRTSLEMVEALVMSLAPHVSPDLGEDDLERAINQMLEVTQTRTKQTN